jgi:predicted metal-dependent hydrolase
VSASRARQLGLFGVEQALVVRRSGRAKRLALRVFPHGVVEVVAPLRVAHSSIEAFVQANAAWIARARDHFRAGDNSTDPPAEIRLAALGERWEVRYEAGTSRLKVATATAGGMLLLRGPPDAARQRARLRRWLIDHGRESLSPWLATVAAETGLRYRGVVVRRQRSRWGSCSAQRLISLNCALLFLEPALVRHLFVHELAHTRHLHHGPAFWRLVASLEPMHEELEARLRQAWRAVPAWVSYDPPPA